MGLVLKNTVKQAAFKKGRIAELRKNHNKRSGGDESQPGSPWAKFETHHQRQARLAMRAHGEVLAPMHTARDGVFKVRKAIRRLDQIAAVVGQMYPGYVNGAGLSHDDVMRRFRVSIDDGINTQNVEVLEGAIKLLLPKIEPVHLNDSNRCVRITWQGRTIRRAILPPADGQQLPTPPPSPPSSPSNVGFVLHISGGCAFSWTVEK